MSHITLADGTKVEVDQVSTHGFAASGVVGVTVNDISPLLGSVCDAVAGTWDKLEKSVRVEDVKIELGLTVEGQAGWIIAKASTSANIKVTMTLKRPQPPGTGEPKS